MKKASWISLSLALAIGIILFACSNSDEPVVQSPGVSSDSSGGDGEYSSDDNSNPNGGNSGDSGNPSSSANRPSTSSSSSNSSPAASSSSRAASSSSVSTTPSCAYKPLWCGGADISNVATASLNNATGNQICTFATSVTMLGNSNTLTVNGTEIKNCGNSGWGQQDCATVLASVPKADGGYYIYEANYYADFTVTGGTPNCNGSVNPGVSSSSKPASSSSAGGSGGGTSSNSGGGGTANTGTPVAGGKSGSGWASRYWDGCKPSCAWKDNAGGNPTKNCGNDGVSKLDNDAQNICMQGGPAHTCYSQTPWQVTDQVAYGFAASHTNGDCGKCFRLTFKGTTEHAANSNALNHIKGKIMVVKISNIGGDVQGNQFDLMIPGGGLGAFDGFSMQTGVNGSVLKASAGYGGFVTDCGGADPGNGALSTLQTCVKNKCTSAFTNADLKAGCDFYADWAGAANNPQFDFQEVSCPSELNSKW